MKTSPYLFVIISLFLASVGMPDEEPYSTTSVNIEIDIGKWPDCFLRGQICQVSALETNSPDIGTTSDALGKAYFNSENRFVIELDILLTDAITEEIADGSFNLDENFQLSPDLMTKLGRSSEVVTLTKGNYPVEPMTGNINRIVF